MVVSGCLVIRKTGKVHGADWHGKIVTFLLYGTAAVHIIWFQIIPMVSDPVSYTHLKRKKTWRCKSDGNEYDG